MVRRVVIMGAAGRDFHDFNVVFRSDPDYEVVGFTQTDTQNVGELESLPDRRYPVSLAGDRYPDGLPIFPESDLERVIESHGVDEVVFSYSDVSHEHVMHQASRAIASGASFRIIGREMMLDSPVPVLAVDAVRTGCGKSQASVAFADILAERGKDVAVVREPMPYGDLSSSAVMRFETYDDLDARDVTIEEREEFEQHVERGHVVYAGVEYEAVLSAASDEADVIVWDGGNNELPFFTPDVHVVLTDPHRPGHERRYHPGEANVRLADYVVINKLNTADWSAVEEITANVESVNPDATVLHADSVVSVTDPDAIAGKRVLCVEDGPTLTHGGTAFGAASIAADTFGAAAVVDPRPVAIGSIKRVLDAYPHLADVLPAMGYDERQLADLEASIDAVDCDVVLAGTPFDLERVLDVDTPVIRVRYHIETHGNVSFDDVVEENASALGFE